MITTLLPLVLNVQNGGVPLPRVWTTLGAIEKVVERGLPPLGDAAPVWRQTQSSWNVAWGQEEFGIGPQRLDTTQCLFRVPPDSGRKIEGGKPACLVEAYENGLPTYGVDRRGAVHARPLGFRYGADGLCVNVSLRALRKGRWTRLRLSKRDRLLLDRILSLNEYVIDVLPTPPRGRFGEPWIRIEAKGYGEYWIARSLECVGPFGAHGRLIDTIESTLRELVGEPALEGEPNGQKPKDVR